MAMDVDEQEFGLEVQAGNLSFGIRVVLDESKSLPSTAFSPSVLSIPEPMWCRDPQGRCSIS
jgi:hypothetical protein